jgi:hypothetical protein
MNVVGHKARHKVLTAVLLKIQVFWYMLLCHLVRSYQCFKESQFLHFQSSAVQELLDPEDESTAVLQNTVNY